MYTVKILRYQSFVETVIYISLIFPISNKIKINEDFYSSKSIIVP